MVILISVTVNFLVTSQLLRKLSATLMGLTLIFDISSSPEECSCHGRWTWGDWGHPLGCQGQSHAGLSRSGLKHWASNHSQLGVSTEGKDENDALLMVCAAKRLWLVAFWTTCRFGKKRWKEDKEGSYFFFFSVKTVVLRGCPESWKLPRDGNMELWGMSRHCAPA